MRAKHQVDRLVAVELRGVEIEPGPEAETARSQKADADACSDARAAPGLYPYLQRAGRRIWTDNTSSGSPWRRNLRAGW